MLKFTETSKWVDPWFQSLSPEAKLFYLFLLDNCDYSGTWEENYRFAEFLIGQSLGIDNLLEELEAKVERLDERKLLLPRFVFFQLRGVEIRPTYNPHKAYAKCLKKHGLIYDHDEGLTRPWARVDQPHKKKKKEKEKTQRQDALIEFPTSADVDDLTASVVVELFNEFCTSLSRVAKVSPKRATAVRARIKEGMDTVQAWTDVFKKVEASNFLTGKQDRSDYKSWRASFDWLMKPDNMNKVIEGNYDAPERRNQDHGKGF